MMKTKIKKCGIQLDHFHQIINVRPTWAKKANNINSDEGKLLKEIVEAFPKYQIMINPLKITKKKECYRGLSYDTMEEYIRSHDPDGSIMVEFTEMKLKSKGHSIRYPNMKHWFLEKYPEYDSFEPFEEKKSA